MPKRNFTEKNAESYIKIIKKDKKLPTIESFMRYFGRSEQLVTPDVQQFWTQAVTKAGYKVRVYPYGACYHCKSDPDNHTCGVCVNCHSYSHADSAGRLFLTKEEWKNVCYEEAEYRRKRPNTELYCSDCVHSNVKKIDRTRVSKGDLEVIFNTNCTGRKTLAKEYPCCSCGVLTDKNWTRAEAYGRIDIRCDPCRIAWDRALD